MHIVEEFQNDTMPDHQHSDVYVSTTTVRIISFIVIIIVIPLLILCGSIGNIISLVVLFHQRMRNQTNYLLAALCVSDTLFLLHSFVFTCLHIYKKNNRIEGEELRAYIYPIVGAYGSVVTARITSGLTTLLCIERFVAVFFPMQARNICSIRNTVLAIILIYVTTLVVFIPFSLKYEAIVMKYGNATKTIMNTTQFYNHNTRFYNVYGTCLNVLFRFAPLVVIPILNVLMIRAVKSTWQQRRKMSQTESQCSLRLSSRNGKHCSSNEQNRITIMLLAVTFVFFICILPGAINSIATHIWPVYSPLGEARNLYLFISAFVFLLETLNSSVNFLIYMFLSRKFRLQYKETFCCGKGEYYRKTSISSVREKFRWSSTRKADRTYENSIFGRKTVSDIGPFRNDNTANQYGKEDWEYAALVKGCDFKIGSDSSSSDHKHNSHKSPTCKNKCSPKKRTKRRLHSASDIDLINGYRPKTLERSTSYKPGLEELNVTSFNGSSMPTPNGKTFHNNNDDFVMANGHEKRKNYSVKFKLAQIMHLKPRT